MNKTGFGFRHFIRVNGLYSAGFISVDRSSEMAAAMSQNSPDADQLVIKAKVEVIEPEK